MKTLLLLPLAFAAPVALHAQWTTPDQNTLIRSGDFDGLATVLTDIASDGTSYLSWYDGFGYNMRMQRLDVNGVKMWGDDGVLVSDHQQLSYVSRYDMHVDHAGNAIVAFQDARHGEDSVEVVVYKLSPTGTQLWGPDGIELRVPGTTGLAPTVGILSDDKVVVTWSTDRSPGTVAYQVFSANGTPMWAEPREWTAASTLNNTNVVPCNDGGFWIQCSRLGAGFPPLATLTVDRFDGNGEEIANMAGDLFVDQTYNYYFTKPISDGHNGLYMGITTFNPDNATLFTVLMQRKREDGSLWSTDGTPVHTGTISQAMLGAALPVLVGDDGGVMLTYTRTDGAQTVSGVAVQRFDTAGVRQLDDEGIEVVHSTTALFVSNGNAATEDGLVFVFSPTADFYHRTFQAMRLALDGSVVWDPAVMDISSTSSRKGFACLTSFVNGQAVLGWTDGRDAQSGVYAQPIRESGTAGIAEVRDNGPARLVGNSGAYPELLFERACARSTLSIRAADGRLVEQRSLTARAAGQREVLTDRTLASGLFQVALESDGQRQSFRWVKP